MRMRCRVSVVIMAVLGAAASSPAAVTLPAVFSDHMVLQRDVPVPVWGTAAAGEKVTVKFQGQEKTATADASGTWLVRLDPLRTSATPDTLVVNGTTITDVLVGDVWLGSGQSNMAMTADKYTQGDPTLATMCEQDHPLVRIIGSSWNGWEVSAARTNQRCSAMLFAFGVPLQEELGTPVGLMFGAVGGTPSGRWLTPAMLAADGPCQEAIKAHAAANPPETRQAQHERALADWQTAVETAKAAGRKVPRKPEPPAAAGTITGGQVGDLFEKHLRPFVPFAIRGVLWDQGEAGTALAGLDQFTVMGALIRGWRRAWGQDFPFLYIQKPSGGGWAFDPEDPMTRRLQALPGQPAQVPPNDAGVYRDMHVRIRNHPDTAMVTSSDLGMGIHPTLKSAYGARAARVALGFAYRRDVEHSGPVFASQKIEGGAIRLGFTHVGKGLVFRGGDRLQGFMVAGTDKRWAWADAVIDGDTVVLCSPQVPEPVAVRYAWADNVRFANLFNRDGLPAVTFRTDDW